MALLCQPVSLSLATRSRKLIYVAISRQYAAACWPSNPPLCMIIHQPRTGAATLWQISSEKERLAFRCPTPRPLPRFAGSLSNVIESADSKLLTCTFEGKKQIFKMSPIWHRQVSVSGRHLHECWCRCHEEKFLWLKLRREKVQSNLMFLWLLYTFKMNKFCYTLSVWYKKATEYVYYYWQGGKGW